MLNYFLLLKTLTIKKLVCFFQCKFLVFLQSHLAIQLHPKIFAIDSSDTKSIFTQINDFNRSILMVLVKKNILNIAARKQQNRNESH